MNKKISISLAITVALLAMTVTFSITMIVAMRMFDNQVQSVQEKESMYGKLSEIDKFVRANYYGEINNDTLYDTIASGYILGLGDRYATYYTAKAYTELQDMQNGKVMGIGVDVVKDASGAARITKVYADSPADQMGMEVDGFITAIDGTEVKGLTRDNVVSRLRGESGTTVKLTYLTPSNEEQTLELTRAQYSTPSVEYQLLAGNRGYIKITAFNNNTPSELSYAVSQLLNTGAAGLVLDVRNNSGDVLNAAEQCVDLLCGEGTVASAEYKDGTIETLYESDDNKVDVPLVCLVNASTASGAELFAANLRDMNGAQIVGVKTMGKGMLQSEPEKLSDGSAVVVTVAKLLTSLGDSFDGVGVVPDVESALTADEEQMSYALTVDTDPQIQRALEVLSSMTGTGTESGSSSSQASSEASLESSSQSQEESSDSETSEEG